MIVRISGQPNLGWFPKKASTALSVGEILKPDGSGAVTVAGASDDRLIGICLREIASSDDDYADTTKIPVDQIDPISVFEADVAGTLTTAMVGEQFDLNSSGDKIDVDGTSNKVFTVVGFISASKALVKINANMATVPAA